MEQVIDRLAIERADLHQRAEVGARVDFGHRQLIDGILRRRETEMPRRQEEQEVRPRHDGQDLLDLLLVLLDPRIGNTEQQVAIVSRHQAVAEQREHHFLRDIEPLGADLPALVVEQYFVARTEQVPDALLVLLARFDQGVPLEVAEDAAGLVAIGAGAGVDGASQLLGSMDAGIGVLGAGEPRTVRPGWLLPVAACRIEGVGVKTVERLVPVRRAHASPDRVLDGGRRGLPASRERRGPRRRGARAQLALLRNAAPHALDEHREFLHVLRPVRQALPRAVARGITPCERRERDAADARRQQEVECIVGACARSRARGGRCGAARSARRPGRGTPAARRRCRRSPCAPRRGRRSRRRPSP